MTNEQNIFFSELATAEQTNFPMYSDRQKPFEELAKKKFTEYSDDARRISNECMGIKSETITKTESPNKRADELMSKAEQKYKNPVLDELNDRLTDLESKNSVADKLYKEVPNPMFTNDDSPKSVRDFFHSTKPAHEDYLYDADELKTLNEYLTMGEAMTLINKKENEGIRITHEGIKGEFWRNNDLYYTNSNPKNETTLVSFAHAEYFKRLEPKFKVVKTELVEATAKWMSDNSLTKGKKINGRDNEGFWF